MLVQQEQKLYENRQLVPGYVGVEGMAESGMAVMEAGEETRDETRRVRVTNASVTLSVSRPRSPWSSGCHSKATAADSP